MVTYPNTNPGNRCLIQLYQAAYRTSMPITTDILTLRFSKPSYLTFQCFIIIKLNIIIIKFISLLSAVCPSFVSALGQASGSTCLPDDDCLGARCDLTIKHGLTTDHFAVKLRVDLDQGLVTIHSNGEDFSFSGNGSLVTLLLACLVSNYF